jgi:chemotaxis protein MotB
MTGSGEPVEVLIIKKRAALDENSVKGGVWKIAFADFMTAMMAFFLVMWLVNATNEETKAQVASYFNPVRLVDAKPQPRGLEDVKEDSEIDPAKPGRGAAPTGDADVEGEDEAAIPGEIGKPGTPAHEAALMRNPMGAIDRIAGAVSPDRGVAQGLDPFAPAHWRTADAPALPKSDSQAAQTGAATAKVVQEAVEATKAAEAAEGEAAPGKQAVSGPDDDPKAQAASLAAEIRKAIALDGGNAVVSVETTGEDVLISLTDSANFGMFAIASASPSAQTVALMDKLAAVLRQRDVRIVVRGHTDGRPFRSDVYDNWRLSSARAHMAAYMLERSGVDEARIVRIEGHADRRLKRPDAPAADENRRIELLVAPGGAP